MRGLCQGRTALTAIAVVAMSMPTGARSAGVEEFYRGHTVSLIIGYSAGSGYDIYARLLARFIGKYIPGHPTVIAQNMPGAGSLKAAMYVHGVAPKDGSVIATIDRTQRAHRAAARGCAIRWVQLRLARQHRQQFEPVHHLAAPPAAPRSTGCWRRSMPRRRT
jgi:tripartite-type tricarboxylate transporter receptor subunit TctC